MSALDDLIKAVEASEAQPHDFHACQDMALMARQDDAISAYRGSLDAALRLHEALLPRSPDGFITLGLHGGAIIHATHDGVQPDFEAEAWGTSPARAWLLAILRALQSMESQGAKGDG